MKYECLMLIEQIPTLAALVGDDVVLDVNRTDPHTRCAR